MALDRPQPPQKFAVGRISKPQWLHRRTNSPGKLRRFVTTGVTLPRDTPTVIQFHSDGKAQRRRKAGMRQRAAPPFLATSADRGLSVSP